MFTKLRGRKDIFEYISQKSIVQFSRYLLVGFGAAAFEYISFNVLFAIVGIGKSFANHSSMLVGFLFSFILNRTWSFNSNSNLFKQLSQLSILFIINNAISALLLYLLSDILHILPQLSKLLIMGVIVLWNFIIYKKIIYR
ncbi:MAG: GtrA family protein [Clostridia bacterium]|nr:GtrA family protein [Clostridia bacterium]